MVKIGKTMIIAVVTVALLLSVLCLPGVAAEQQAGAGNGAVCGDVNGDGSINAVDATRVLLYAVDKVTLADEQMSTADVSGDEKVNAADATLILLHTVGKKLISDESDSTTTTTTTTTTEPTTTTTTLPPYNNKENKVTVPEPVYNEEYEREVYAVYPTFCIIVLTPEQAALNETLTPDYFPDIPIYSMGVEIGASDRWYVILDDLDSFEMFQQVVDRVQDYDFVQTIEFIPLDMKSLSVDGWYMWWSRDILVISSEQQLTPNDFPTDGPVSAIVPIPDIEPLEGDNPYWYYAFMCNGYDWFNYSFFKVEGSASVSPFPIS